MRRLTLANQIWRIAPGFLFGGQFTTDCISFQCSAITSTRTRAEAISMGRPRSLEKCRDAFRSWYRPIITDWKSTSSALREKGIQHCRPVIPDNCSAIGRAKDGPDLSRLATKSITNRSVEYPPQRRNGGLGLQRAGHVDGKERLSRHHWQG